MISPRPILALIGTLQSAAVLTTVLLLQASSAAVAGSVDDTESASVRVELSAGDVQQRPPLVPDSGRAPLAPGITVSVAELDVIVNRGSNASETIVMTNTGTEVLDYTLTVRRFRKIAGPPPMSGGAMPAGDGCTRSTVKNARPPDDPLAPQTYLNELRILWDQSHGQYPPSVYDLVVGDLQNAGAVITANEDPLTYELLLEHHVFFSGRGNRYAYSSGERAALADWVAGGGSVFLACDGELANNQILSAIGSDLWIEHAPPGPEFAEQITPHAITAGVTKVRVFESPRVVVDNPGAVVLARNDTGEIYAAICEVGEGRVFVTAFEFYDSIIQANGQGNRAFFNQAMEWLGAFGQSLFVFPTSGTLAPAAQVDVLVAFSVAEHSLGHYAADIEIEGSMPGGSYPVVPVKLRIVDETLTEVPSPELIGLNLHNAPNPFNPGTEFRFNLPRSGQLEIKVHDLRGSLVRLLRGGVMQTGSGAIAWNGLDAHGRQAASGVYVGRLFLDDLPLGRPVMLTMLK